MRAARRGGGACSWALPCALGGGGAWRRERSPQSRPAGRALRAAVAGVLGGGVVCAALTRWPGSEGAALALVTPECATEERGAPPRPAGPAPRPLPLAAAARALPPQRSLPSGGGLLRAVPLEGAATAAAGWRARALSEPRVRYGESSGCVRLLQL